MPLAASLFLAISGSTIMNMWYDRDIDAKMKRTHMRPTASGKLYVERNDHFVDSGANLI